MKTIINAVGIKEIADFLSTNHKKGSQFDAEQLQAWAREAEFQLGEGNPASIELKAYESIHGRTQEYTVSDAGIDDDGLLVFGEDIVRADAYYMNPHTGSVQSAADWAADGYTPDNAELVEVVRNENGDWVEA